MKGQPDGTDAGEAEVHPVDELAALVDGGLDLDELRPVVRHLRRCPACQAELVEVAAATGALRHVAPSEAELAADGLPAPGPLTPVVPGALDGPPERLWMPRLADGPGWQAPGRDPAPVVPLAAAPSARRRRARAWLAAAAAAAIVLAGTAVAVDRAAHGGHQPSVAVSLRPLGESEASGMVVMRGAGVTRAMSVDTSLPPLASGSFYEVWLLDVHTGGMVPVGVLPAEGKARFALPSSVVGRYDAVDISLQPDDGSTAHSAVSVLRASYAA